MRVRMQAVEALIWTVQQRDPRLRSDVVALAVLDRSPDDAALRRRLAAVADAIPALRSVVRPARLPFPTPELVVDPDFDPVRHVRRVRVPAPGSTAALLDLVGLLAEAPLDPDLPRWELTVLDGLADGRAAVAVKIDHVLTDGARGMQLAAALLDPEDETPPERITVPAVSEPSSSILGSLFGVAGRAVRLPMVAAERMTAAATAVLRSTVHAPSRALDALRVADSLRRQSVVVDHARSGALTGRSLQRHLDTIRVSIDDVHSVAQARGVSVNDVFVTAVADALGDYHEAVGLPCEELRMAMSVSTRLPGEDDAANRFAPVRVLVPVSGADTGEHLAAIHEILERARSEPATAFIEPLACVLLALPAPVLVSMFRAQANSVDFATSNLRGAPDTVRLVGARVEALYAFGPRMGVPVNVTMLSYAGGIELALNIDPAAVTDPAVLVACLHEAFGKLHRLG